MLSFGRFWVKKTSFGRFCKILDDFAIFFKKMQKRLDKIIFFRQNYASFVDFQLLFGFFLKSVKMTQLSRLKEPFLFKLKLRMVTLIFAGLGRFKSRASGILAGFKGGVESPSAVLIVPKLCQNCVITCYLALCKAFLSFCKVKKPTKY